MSFVLCVFLLVVPLSTPLQADSETERTVRIRVNNDTPGRAINRLLLGNNIEWTQRGDGLLEAGSLDFRPTLAQRLNALAPTVIRFPGGTFADTYHWQRALGPLDQRGSIENTLTRAFERADFGTSEFLLLCRQTGAQPLITPNVVTGTPTEAAAWLRATNVERLAAPDGTLLPRVPYWEMGNEPYLTGERPDLALTPAAYAARANAFSAALRQVDPDVQLGVPLLGHAPAQIVPEPQRHFNKTVLATLAQPPDFYAVHNAYLPAYFKDLPPQEDVYYQALASPWLVKRDLDALHAQINARFPDQPVRFALSEYNALYTLGKPDTDSLSANFTSALYVADLLLSLAQRDDVLMANYWSLLDNYVFGALDAEGRPRPAYPVLSAFSEVFRGKILATTVTGPTFDAPAAQDSLFPGASGLPLVTALALQTQGDTRMVLINKDLHAAHAVELSFSTPIQPQRLTSRGYTRDDVFEVFLEGDPTLGWRPSEVELSAGTLKLTLAPHAIRIVSWQRP